MTLLEFLNRMKVNIRGPKFKKVSARALKNYEYRILSKLRANSPEDTGQFKRGWEVSIIQGTSDSLAEMVIRNKTEEYAEFMELGAEPGKAPWYFPHKNKKGTGKLRLGEGRVWAGGLNPGGDTTIGGVFQNVFAKRSKLLDRLTIDVSDSVIKAFL